MIETHVDRARDAVGHERELLAEEGTAYEEFCSRITPLSATEVGPGTGAGGSPRGGLVTVGSRSDTGGAACEQVCKAFAETIQPYSVADVEDEPLLETIRKELGDSVAVAVAPTTDPGFTTGTKGAVLSAARERHRGIEATIDALDSEAESLHRVSNTVEEITDWLAAADETPLSTLGFDALASRHERLAEHRERVADRLDDRQALLGSTTGRNRSADITHRSLVRYLYEPLPVVYPVLSTLTRLYDLIVDCQRTVRTHLTRCA